MNATAASLAPPTSRDLRDARNDRLFRGFLIVTVVLVLTALACAALSMLWGGRHALQEQGLSFFYTADWNPVENRFGALAPIYGTIVTALIAMLIAVPVSFGIAFFLTEVAPRWLRTPVGTAIELLAGVPSIIYGMWGLFVFVPLFAKYVQQPVNSIVEGMPIVGTLFKSASPSGLGILTAGFILAFMIIPFIASITRDMIDQIPTVLRESAYGIGATTWEVVNHVLIPQAGVAIIGAVMLGLGRALGETMAVTFVVGNANRLSASLLDPGSTIASRIANEFNEAIGLQLHALIALGCILFFVTFVVLVIARLLVARVKRY